MPTFNASGLILLLIVALLSNIPLGYLRQGVPRYSWRWFLYIHLSIPLIIALRLLLGLDWRMIPFSIGSAVVGQVLGARLCRQLRR